MRALLTALLLVVQAPAYAEVLSFEGINTALEGSPLQSPYGGFEWNRTTVVYPDGVTPLTLDIGPAHIFKQGVLMNMPAAAVSGEWFLLSGGDANEGTIIHARSDVPFNLMSAFVTRANDQPDMLLVSGFADGELVASQLLAPDAFSAKVNFNFLNLDEITFQAIFTTGNDMRGPYIGIDDIEVHFLGPPNNLGPQPVPEPINGALLLGGLVGIAVMRRRKRE
jgi:hypothetical protein